MSAKKKQEERRKKLHFEASKAVLSIAWLAAPVELVNEKSKRVLGTIGPSTRPYVNVPEGKLDIGLAALVTRQDP